MHVCQCARVRARVRALVRRQGRSSEKAGNGRYDTDKVFNIVIMMMITTVIMIVLIITTALNSGYSF